MTEIQATDYFWPWAVEQLPGDPAADPELPPCCHPGQDEVVEDDEDEHRGDDGGGEGVDKLVVQLQVQVQVDGLANGCHGEDLHNSLFVTDSILGNIIS